MIRKESILIATLFCLFSFRPIAAENLTDLFWEGHIAYKMKQYSRAAELYRKIIEKGYSDPDAVYNATGCYALAGNPEKAFEYLKILCSNEFIDTESFLNDADFKPLKNDQRWPTAVNACRTAEKRYIASSNPILYQLYLKSNNNPGLASDVAKEVLKLVSSKQLKTSNDYFHAAAILTFLNDPSSLKLAEKLAEKADSMHPNHPQASSLTAVARDRYLWSVKEPQVYGTQIRQEKDKKWTYEPFNRQGVSDAQRAAAHVLSLATLDKRLQLLNEKGIE